MRGEAFTLSTFSLAVIHRILSIGGEHVGETFVVAVVVGSGKVMRHELLHLWVVDGLWQSRHLVELPRHDGDRWSRSGSLGENGRDEV